MRKKKKTRRGKMFLLGLTTATGKRPGTHGGGSHQTYQVAKKQPLRNGLVPSNKKKTSTSQSPPHLKFAAQREKKDWGGGHKQLSQNRPPPWGINKGRGAGKGKIALAQT